MATTASPFKKRKARPGTIKKRSTYLDCAHCLEPCRVDAETTKVTCGRCALGLMGKVEG